MAGNFDVFDAYSGGRGNLGLIPGYILAFTKADLLGECGPYPPRGPCVRWTCICFQYFVIGQTAEVACFDHSNRGA